VVTGSEAISYRQAAEIIGAAIGKPLSFVDESPDEPRSRWRQEYRRSALRIAQRRSTSA
jgi:uncharacterized protein YbjT (DUF2867 family)